MRAVIHADTSVPHEEEGWRVNTDCSDCQQQYQVSPANVMVTPALSLSRLEELSGPVLVVVWLTDWQVPDNSISSTLHLQACHVFIVNIQHRVGLLLQLLVTLHIIYIESYLQLEFCPLIIIRIISTPQVPDARRPGLLTPVVPHFLASPNIYLWCVGSSHPSSDPLSNCLLYIRSTEANCCHKIP